jgi:quercetin dioxygenase-like cupin family protein
MDADRRKGAMKTIDISPREMSRYIARFDDLVANKVRTGDRIPPEAREMLTARATRTVIAHSAASDTPWGAGGDGGPIPGPEKFAVVIAECEPGNGPGLHSHQSSTETFTCIKGRFRIEWGDAGQHAIELGLFDTISVPPAVMRRFVNISDETGLLYVILQGGERGLGDVEFAPAVGEELRARFGDDVMRELESVGYSFDAGVKS